MAIATALADDAVAIGRVALRGPGSAASIRAQLAACPTPSLRPWVFVRRLTIATRGGSAAPEFAAALARLATAAAGENVVVFADFATLATGFARDVLGGVAAARWHWRRLGVLARWSGVAAVFALLAEQPLEIWAVLERLHDEALLVPIWRQLTPDSAAMLLGAVGWATGTTLPDRIEEAAAAPLPARLEPAVAFWREALTQTAAPHAASHVAAMLSLLRWDPTALAMQTAAAARLAALVQTWRLAETAPLAAPPLGPRRQRETIESSDAAAAVPPTRHPRESGDPVAAWVPAFAEMTMGTAGLVVTNAAASRPIIGAIQAHEIPTDFGGVLFLINTLNRLDIMRRLVDWSDGEPPSGWQLLHDLARMLGAPEEDQLIAFLTEQMGEPMPAATCIAELAAAAAEFYEAEEIWPDFLRHPGVLRATASHLDLELRSTTIDIRIRRAGLDLDPTWVPWLGRVVRFHYPWLPQRPVP